MRRILSHTWLAVIVVLVVAVAGFAVSQVREVFGANPILVTPNDTSRDSKSFDPKVVTYEVLGQAGAVADINYLDLDSRPQRVDGAPLPWTLTLTTDAPAASPNIVAQGPGDIITCRILIDNELKAEQTSTGVKAHTFCVVKSQ